MRFRTVLALLLAGLAGCAAPRGEEPEGEPFPEPPAPRSGWTKERKALVLNAALAGAVAAYGSSFWDYGGKGFGLKGEGWFSKNTSYGGADKLGHAYSSYLATEGIASLYESWGYEHSRASLFGALTSAGALTLVEVGDGFSKHGLSREDLVMDVAGALLGYLRRENPALRRLLDFRVEYLPSGSAGTDLLTDYSGYKYLLALKLDGIERLENSWLRNVELHVGYFTRGYGSVDPSADRTRHVYVGVGFNLSRLFRKTGFKKTSAFLSYYQVPYTYLSTDG